MVGITAAKRSHANRNASGNHLREDMNQNRSADAFALGAWMCVEVVEKQPLRLRLHDNESDPLTVNLEGAKSTGELSICTLRNLRRTWRKERVPLV